LLDFAAKWDSRAGGKGKEEAFIFKVSGVVFLFLLLFS
jgi:hypothetical protein